MSGADKKNVNVLIVEDNPDLRELLAFNLRREGYRATAVTSGEDAFKKLKSESFHLVILDRRLPGIEGAEVCKKIRAHPEWQRMSVVFLTAKDKESDVIDGLECGADDYIVKPFSPRVLLARIRSHLRRNGILANSTTIDDIEDSEIVVGKITLRPARREVRVGSGGKDRPIELTATEFNLLQVLMRRPGIVFSREQLLDRLHGDGKIITDRAIDVQIVGLRKKLGVAGEQIETARGAGYKFMGN